MKRGKYIRTEKQKQRLSALAKSRVGSKAPNWKGGKMIVDDYWYVYSPDHPHRTKDKYVLEHRLIMEKKLNRFLDPLEIVHHINGIKTDNRLKNLVVCQSNSAHTSIHNKTRPRSNGRFSKV